MGWWRTEGNFPGRRLLNVLLVGMLLLWVAGCGNGQDGKSTGKRLRIGLMITPRGLNDQGFNDQAFSGLKEAERKYGIDPVVIEPATMKDPEASLRFFAGQRFDAIIAVGMAFQDAIRKVKAEQPELPFFVIDSTLDEGNIRGVTFREDEGSFLCGYLAARLSPARKIGFIGGIKIEVIERFWDGFRNGALFAASETEVLERYVAEDFSGFNKPEVANTIALDLYHQGCDVIYHAAGASGLGVISAAVKAKKYVIGVDMNQDPMAPGLVLTSMLKRVDFVVEDVVRTLSEGKEPSAVKRTYGMADGAIDLTDFQFTQQVVGDDLIARIGELRKQIVAGNLKTRSNPAPAIASSSDSILLPLPSSVGN